MIVSPPTPVSSLSLPPASPGGGNLELLHMRFHVGAQAQPGDFLGTEVKRSHPGSPLKSRRSGGAKEAGRDRVRIALVQSPRRDARADEGARLESV